ncbi:MAG: YfiR family protein [Smithella sp.]
MDKKKILINWLLFLIGFAVTVPPLHCEERKHGEYEVKAAFLYNIGKFIEWPERRSESREYLIVGILGHDCFNGKLEMLRGKKIRGRKILIKKISSICGAKNCDVLFISSSEKSRINLILKELANKPILTVGDTESFEEKGVMINFYIENERIRFAINNEAAKRADVKIHSNLLALGRIVSP